MVVDNTVYADEPGERKQLSMDGWAAQALTTANNLTKGVVAHECLMMADEDLSDEFTAVEERAFADAEDIVSALDEMVSARVGSSKDALADDCNYDDPYERVTADIYLIQSVVDDLPQRYVGDMIADSVAYTRASPWSSRFERLQDVLDLVEYRDTGSAPDDVSTFVADIIDGESDRWDVADLHAIVDRQDWWERDDVSMATMNANGADIPKTSAKRIPAFKTALGNLDDSALPMDYDKAWTHLEVSYSDMDKSSYKNYIDKLIDEGYVEEQVEEYRGPSLDW